MSKVSKVAQCINQVLTKKNTKERIAQCSFKKFRVEDMSIGHNGRSKRPSACDDDHLKDTIEANHNKK